MVLLGCPYGFETNSERAREEGASLVGLTFGGGGLKSLESLGELFVLAEDEGTAIEDEQYDGEGEVDIG